MQTFVKHNYESKHHFSDSTAIGAVVRIFSYTILENIKKLVGRG